MGSFELNLKPSLRLETGVMAWCGFFVFVGRESQAWARSGVVSGFWRTNVPEALKACHDFDRKTVSYFLLRKSVTLMAGFTDTLS